MTPCCLAACRQSAGTSTDGDPNGDPPSADVLDLDWALTVLERVCERAGLDSVHLNALRQATEGDSVIDLGFLDTHPHAIGPFGPPPTALSAAQVARVSELLGQIDFLGILAGLPTEDSEAASLIGHGADKTVGGPRNYPLGHVNALREFYLAASQRHLLLVLWWD
ncbi:DUF1877 domain-containing protein [Streptomyces sp. QTS52]